MVPTGFASTVDPLAAAPEAPADAAGATEAGATDAGAWEAGAADDPLELQPATTAMTKRGATRARKRMGMSVTSLRIGRAGRVEPDTEIYVSSRRPVCAFNQSIRSEGRRGRAALLRRTNHGSGVLN